MEDQLNPVEAAKFLGLSLDSFKWLFWHGPGPHYVVNDLGEVSFIRRSLINFASIDTFYMPRTRKAHLSLAKDAALLFSSGPW